jgi:hypothetical protein
LLPNSIYSITYISSEGIRNMRKIRKYTLKTLLGLYCSSIVACPDALPITDARFCASFDVAAQCYCTSSGLPKKMCGSTQKVYDRMMSIFHSIESACSFQHNTPYQNCLDNWHCYMLGGSNNANEWCSGSGAACIG